jgi:hypothetical protein
MGDRAILSGTPSMGGVASMENIDANSRQTESYSEPRAVDGKNVFLTPDDAAKLDSLRGDGANFTVVTNGHTWDRLKAAVQEFLER